MLIAKRYPCTMLAEGAMNSVSLRLRRTHEELICRLRRLLLENLLLVKGEKS
jgi:hypothetical protein